MAQNTTKLAANQVLVRTQKALAGIDAKSVANIAAAAGFLAGRPGKIIACGVGKSGFIAAKVASTLTSLGVSAVTLHPTDALHGDLGMVRKTDVVLAFSHSGDTRELVQTLGHVARLHIPIVAITGNPSSRLAMMSEHVLTYRLSGEGSPHGLAPMASTTASLVIGDMLAAEIAVVRGFTRERFARLHPSGSLGLQMTSVAQVMLRGSRMPNVQAAVSFRTAIRQINDKKLGITAVVDRRGRLIGALTDGDIRRFILAGREPNKAMVADAMTPKPKTVTADTSLHDALAVMEAGKITSLFVVDRTGRPRGIVHMHQIIERQLA